MDGGMRGIQADLMEIFDAVPTGIIIIDPENHRILGANQSASRMIGKTASEIVGSICFKYICQEEGSCPITDLGQLIDQPERILITSDGRSIPIMKNVSQLFYNDHRYLLENFFDISKLKQAEMAILHSEEQLKISESKYRAIIEDMPLLICRFSHDGILAFVNDAYCRYFKRDREDLIGRSFLCQIPEEARGTILDHLSSLKPDKPIVTYTHEVLLQDGGVAWQRWTDRGIFDSQGTIVEYQSIGEDISLEVAADLELKRRDILLAEVARAARIFLSERDFERAIGIVLDGLGRASGVDRVYVFQNTISEDGEPLMTCKYEWVGEGIVPQIDNPSFQMLPYNNGFNRWYNSFLDGLPIYGPARNFPESEQDILISMGIFSTLMVPISNKGTLWGYIGFDDCHSERSWSEIDISILQAAAASFGGAIERIAAEEEIAQARDLLEQRILERTADLASKTAEMERFIYTVSHDLRSPLVTVNGFVGFLKNDLEHGDVRRIEEDLDLIEQAVSKMDRLLEDTLELSRIGRVVNPPEAVPFGLIVKEALDQIGDKLETGGFDVLHPSDFPSVCVDRMRIVEVLVNLIENSVKYKTDHVQPLVEIGHRKDGDDIVFFVRDNGIGIDASQHKKVFGLFYKINPNSEGTGAGLSIVQRIIEVHGGVIWIESEFGKGCTICFTLPVVE